MARVNGQRMGRGPEGCVNMANWNHFFTPNSDAARAARANCVDYWMNIGQDPLSPKRLKSESGNDDVSKSMLSPKNVIMLLVVLAVVYYFMRK
tara:strand:- start:1196 stop:1474 length:279 start_codon:yes stop_codon:yes gene_type:complete